VIKPFAQVIVFTLYFLASLFVPPPAAEAGVSATYPRCTSSTLSNRLQGTAILGREDRCFGTGLPAIDARPIRVNRRTQGVCGAFKPLS
jgi:hypothetical protein